MFRRLDLASLVLLLVISSVRCGGGTSPHPDGGLPDGGPGSTTNCGDSVHETGEACDDGNTAAGDGCSATCTVEQGWFCPPFGGRCTEIPCGDGVLNAGETCDDGNLAVGDGCNEWCATEPGWNCGASGKICQAAACGDGVIAGAEECEDGATLAGDGCDENCRLEEGFKCEVVGAACERTDCGDGTAEGTEECDDGNHDMGDSCSPLCKREPVCSNGVCTAVCGDGVILPNDTSEECDDGNGRANDGCSPTCKLETGFTCQLVTEEPPDTLAIPVVYRDFRGNDLDGGHIDFQNKNNSEQGIVGPTLGSNGKPVYAKDGVSSATTHGKAAFDQWYSDHSEMNRTIVSTLALARQGDGSYVFDDQSFWPLDSAGFVAEGLELLRPGNDGSDHNFNFTSEARYWFEYKGTEVLTFLGDDDVFVFINRRLALDLGGVHGPQTGTVTLADQAAALGLTVGGIYEVAVFQAERHTGGSNYILTLSNFESRRSECRPLCGDGIKQPEAGEDCDDGNNTDGDGCSAKCHVEIG